MNYFGKISFYLFFFIFCLSCDQNLNVTKSFKISKNIEDIFNKENNDNYFLIAHAGGGIDNNKYTNSQEAIFQSIDSGYKLIEIDLIETSDQKLVGAHDWDHFRNISNCCKSSNNTPTLNEFNKFKILDNFHTVNYQKINEIFTNNEDLILVTDKTNNFELINNLFTFDKKRIIVEIFGRENYFRAIKEDIKNPMYSANINEIDFIKKYNIKIISVHSNDFMSNKNTYKELSKNGTIIFVYSSNDIKFIEENKLIVSSFYSDFIDIKNKKCTSIICETY